MNHLSKGIATLIAALFFFLFSFTLSVSVSAQSIDCGITHFEVNWHSLCYSSKKQCFADLVLNYWTVRSVDEGADSLLVCVDSLLSVLKEADAKNLRIIDDIFNFKVDIFAKHHDLLEQLKDYRKTVFLYFEAHPPVDEEWEGISIENIRLKAVTDLQRKLLHAYKSGILDMTALEELYPQISLSMSLEEVATVLDLFEEKRKKD